MGQNTQIRHFWFHFLLLLSTLLFSSIFGVGKNSRVMISNMTLPDFSLKILKKGFFGPSLRIFTFAQSFAF